jgi:hypothetical protein
VLIPTVCAALVHMARAGVGTRVGGMYAARAWWYT